LGIISENGYGVPSQPKISLLYYSIAASYGSDAAFIKLGECYKNGFGV
jgi:TPR repeat protein